MTMRIVDTSAIMAVVLGERGHETAALLARNGFVSSVNLAEVVAKCIDQAVPQEVALAYLKGSNIEILDFDHDLAILAGQLRSAAPKGVLSLGDRACIATAIRAGGIAVTADRAWAALELPCPVELIR